MVHVSQRTAGYIRRHRLSYTLSACFNGVSRRKYVYCCIVVTIMFCSALRANPFSVCESQRLILESTDVAQLGTWVKSVNNNQLFSVPVAFISKHLPEGIETYFRDCTAEFPVFNHVINGKVFNGNNIIISDQSSSEFVQIIFSGIGNSFMQSCDFQPLTVPSFAPFLSAGKNLLLSFQLFHVNRQELGIIDFLTSRQGDKAIDAEINSDSFAGFRQRFNIFVKDERDKVFPGRGLGYRNRCGIAFKTSAPFDLEFAEAGYRKAFIDTVPLECSLSIFGRLFVPFLFENRIIILLTEKIGKSSLQMSECLLSWNARNFIEPYGLRITFPACEHGAGFIVIDRFFSGFPCFFADRESTVVHIPAASEYFFKMQRLLFGRIDSVCVSDFHSLLSINFSYIVNKNLGGKAASSAS